MATSLAHQEGGVSITAPISRHACLLVLRRRMEVKLSGPCARERSLLDEQHRRAVGIVNGKRVAVHRKGSGICAQRVMRLARNTKVIPVDVQGIFRQHSNLQEDPYQL